jgi:CRISPR-associated protein Csb2
MSTSLAVAFPWGRYHATPWGRHVNEAAIEWPPSPWRLLRALYATWRSRAPHLEERTVHRLLDALAAPPVFVLPEFVEAHTRHYLPPADFPRSKRDKAFDAFVAFDPATEVVVTWPFDLDPPEREALGELASLLPYLGRAESICQARLLHGPPPDGTRYAPVDAEHTEGGEAPLVELLAPDQPLDVAALTASTTRVRGARRLDPPATHRLLYARPMPAGQLLGPHRRHRSAAGDVPDGVRLSVAGPALPSLRAAVGIADALRMACMSWFGQLSNGDASAILAGKDAAGTPLVGHGHAHYLALDQDGDRLVDHLVIWVPAGLGPAELRAVDQLHTRPLTAAYARDLRPVRLAVEAIGKIAEVAGNLVGPSRRWVSHTPFAPPRHRKKRQTWEAFAEAEVRRELRLRGLPDPIAITHLPHDWLSFRRHRLRERLEDARHASGLEVVFEASVHGPLALGALSHYGLGLFLPLEGR